MQKVNYTKVKLNKQMFKGLKYFAIRANDFTDVAF